MKKVIYFVVISFVFLSIQNAFAATFEPYWENSSKVTEIVTDNLDGTWDYRFTVHNTSVYHGPDGDVTSFPNPWEGGLPDGAPIIIDWELPYFSDMGISNYVQNWAWSNNIETIGTSNPDTWWEGDASWQNPGDPWYAGPTSPFTTGIEVLHWYDSTDDGESSESPWGWDFGILPGEYLGGFGFTANFAPGSAPYQASWAILPVQTGDPAFPFSGLPQSPSITGTGPAIPEPTTILLFGLGLLGLSGVNRRKK